ADAQQPTGLVGRGELAASQAKVIKLVPLRGVERCMFETTLDGGNRLFALPQRDSTAGLHHAAVDGLQASLREHWAEQVAVWDVEVSAQRVERHPGVERRMSGPVVDLVSGTADPPLPGVGRDQPSVDIVDTVQIADRYAQQRQIASSDRPASRDLGPGVGLSS